ncbi:MAG TPA: hypothetical protein VLB83_03795 [Candidatus Paceibacterota bacterium]|nr:hypothetical protein [Candidatus Paceibacterota bacterium]
MGKQSVTFSVNQLIVGNGDDFSTATFSALPSRLEEKHELPGLDGNPEPIGVRIISTLIQDNRFVAIHFNDGEKYPYSKEVVDLKDLSHKKNPRSRDEVELDRHSFVLIDCQRKLVFFSNLAIRKEFPSFISKKANVRITAKMLIDEEQFREKLREIEEISLCAVPDPNIQPNALTLEEMLKADAYGYGASRATLKFSYKKTQISDSLRDKIFSLTRRMTRNFHVTIIGRTSDGFEAVFNTEQVTSRVQISVPRDDDTGDIEADQVFLALINQVK